MFKYLFTFSASSSDQKAAGEDRPMGERRCRVLCLAPSLISPLISAKAAERKN
jgi:hypothetical protein